MQISNLGGIYSGAIYVIGVIDEERLCEFGVKGETAQRTRGPIWGRSSDITDITGTDRVARVCFDCVGKTVVRLHPCKEIGEIERQKPQKKDLVSAPILGYRGSCSLCSTSGWHQDAISRLGSFPGNPGQDSTPKCTFQAFLATENNNETWLFGRKHVRVCGQGTSLEGWAVASTARDARRVPLRAGGCLVAY